MSHRIQDLEIPYSESDAKIIIEVSTPAKHAMPGDRLFCLLNLCSDCSDECTSDSCMEDSCRSDDD